MVQVRTSYLWIRSGDRRYTHLRMRRFAAMCMLLMATAMLGQDESSAVASQRDRDVKPPQIVQQRAAEFPESARKNKRGGTVMVSLIVETNGLPSNIQVVQSAGKDFDEQAIKAVEKYVFKPALKDGQPVRYALSVEVDFHSY
jgi:TonB family protein